MDVDSLKRVNEISDELNKIDKELNTLDLAYRRRLGNILVVKKFRFRVPSICNPMEIDVSNEDIRCLIDLRLNRRKVLLEELKTL